jgi:hypothetical protein
MWDGKIAGELPAQALESEIMLMATGHKAGNGANPQAAAGVN